MPYDEGVKRNSYYFTNLSFEGMSHPNTRCVWGGGGGRLAYIKVSK